MVLWCSAATTWCAAESSKERGNWRKKNEIAREAESELAKLPPLIERIESVKDPFAEKFASAQQLLDKFYADNGIASSDFDALKVSVTEHLNELEEAERSLLSELDPQAEPEDSEVIADITQKREQFLTLLAELQTIGTFKGNLRSYVARLDEVIADAKSAQAQAQEMYRQILQTLDHKNAEMFYYGISAHHETLKQAADYVEGRLSSDFDAALHIVDQRLELVAKQIQELENQGIIIRDRLERLRAMKEEKEAQEAARQSKGATQHEWAWYDYLLWPFRAVVQALGSWW